MIKIIPSLMCANLARLEEELASLEAGCVDYYHFDIMDGLFVPNFSLSPDMIRALRPLTDKPFDVHLMVEEPEKYIDNIISAGANMISVHVESTVHLHRILEGIRSKGVKAGVAFNPSTSLDSLDYIMDMIDYVCIMAVNPGFSGQPFISSTFNKIKDLKSRIDQSPYEIDIEVDGNISIENIPKVIECGAQMLVCGTSSLFVNSQDLSANVKHLREIVERESRCVRE